MLVLSRKKNETIIIDGRITIEVVQVKGKGVRLGINAPNDVRILRGELKPFGMESPEESKATIDIADIDIADFRIASAS